MESPNCSYVRRVRISNILRWHWVPASIVIIKNTHVRAPIEALQVRGEAPPPPLRDSRSSQINALDTFKGRGGGGGGSARTCSGVKPSLNSLPRAGQLSITDHNFLKNTEGASPNQSCYPPTHCYWSFLVSPPAW